MAGTGGVIPVAGGPRLRAQPRFRVRAGRLGAGGLPADVLHRYNGAIVVGFYEEGVAVKSLAGLPGAEAMHADRGAAPGTPT